MRFSSKSTSSTFSPARNVLSMTRPSFMCLSLVRTKGPALAGLHVLEIDDAVRLTVELDLQPPLELRGRHLHRSGPFRF